MEGRYARARGRRESESGWKVTEEARYPAFTMSQNNLMEGAEWYERGHVVTRLATVFRT